MLDLWWRAGLGGWVDESKRLRNLWLADLARLFDRTMRSTAFLELMQHNLGAMTRATRAMSELPWRQEKVR